ncbi:hypothetical protein niasHT_011292 [Heterodera trifolii]|uniref:DENN domain-containing protein 5B n=1 Tax=Heterodera trifolii TaxID=157864 RepID=A0ABD2LC71_9BILA
MEEQRRPICDYFAIIGYDPASGLKQERIAEFGDPSLATCSTSSGPPVRKSPLDATYEPKVIAHFPTERPGRPFAPEIASLALPQGIRLRTERNVPREPFFHSFVVIREDGSRIYGCSLIFFEELSSIELRQQIFNAQLEYLREFATSGLSTTFAQSATHYDDDDDDNEHDNADGGDLSPPMGLSQMATDQRRENDQLLLMARNEGHPTPHRSPYNHHQSPAPTTIGRKFTTHSLPRKFGKQFGTTNGGAHSAINAGDSSADARREHEHVTYYKNPKSPLFISKCLAIITPIPVIYSSENLLHNLWALISEKFPLREYSVEDLLHWMLHDLYLPAPACSAQLCFSNFHLLLRVPSVDEMPFFDYPIETLFAHIGVDQFVKLLTSFMLEQQILLISKNARNLMLVAECLSVLVFPFCWQMPYCPILPHTQLKFLEAPIPWLMGICVGEQQLPNRQQLYQCNICLLDIDARRLEVPEDLPSFPRQQRMISEINALLARSASAADQQQQKQAAEDKGVHTFYMRGLQFNAAIRQLFLDHFVSLFSTYEAYLLHAGTEHGGIVSVPKSRRKNGRMFRESSANFDKISFLVDQPESVLSFLSAFLETQMFTSFIDTKILSAQNLHTKTINVQLFDEKIAALSSTESQKQQTMEGKNSQRMAKLEFPRPRPGCSSVQPQKYGGFLPIPAQSVLEPPATAVVPNNRNFLANNAGTKNAQQRQGEEEVEEPFNDENRQSGNPILCQNLKTDDSVVPNAVVGEAKQAQHGGAIAAAQKSAPMNMAHQNWRFVEQLLKETKAKTKRILVAKMGNEAVHLGHGHLHLGISGVEENTLVASFCDLLERIWSHGLKKKQGKSALWNYIIAYHEWEKKSNREASRKASLTAGGTTGESQSGEEEDEDKVSTTVGTESDDNGTPKAALVDLISSIRRMASAGGGDDGDNASLSSAASSGTVAATTPTVPDWSQSLLRAANVICERISGAGGSDIGSGGDFGGASDSIGDYSKKSATLPPRPPPPRPSGSSSSRSRQAATEAEPHPQQQQQRRSRTPTPNSKKNARVPAKASAAATGTAVMVVGDSVKNEEKREKNTETSGGGDGTPSTYRKFIYKGPPLKEMNNNNSNTSRRSVSSQRRTPTSGGGVLTNLFTDLASHLSEDSLSRLALSSVPAAAVGTDTKGTPTRRRTRELSIGPASGHSVVVPPRPAPRNRSLSRTSSPSRFYEKLTRGASIGGGGGGDLRTLKPLPSTMSYDLKNIMRMTEIKTDIGFARAFVRLALERKLLYLYLKKLLANTPLLQKMYKRNAFLRCDEEREQFLFHLLSLNAVDFNCFTNTFLTIKMRYEVLLEGSLDRFPASLLYIVMTGSHGCTSSIFLPANSVQFTFDFKNLGTLSTLRIGHTLEKDKTNSNNNNFINNNNNSNQRLSKWFLKHVLVRNCVTAQTFYFRCGRWFGRGIDDGALERLLVAEAIVTRRHYADGSDEEEAGPTVDGCGSRGSGGAEMFSSGIKSEQYLLQHAESPLSAAAAFLSPRKAKFSNMDSSNSTASGGRSRDRSYHRRFRSPSCERRNSGDVSVSGSNASKTSGCPDKLQVLEHRVGIAVNALTKHFLTSTDKDQQSRNAKLSTLLCSEDGGLLPSLDGIFEYGLIQRFLRPMYPWDYIEKVFVWFRKFFCSGESKKFTQEQRSLIIYTYNLVSKISAHNAVGKEGKFHLFILFSLRDHILSGLLPLIAWTQVTSQLYDQSAFLRQPSKLSYLSKLISTLNEFQFLYEKSLLQGIEDI